MNQFIHHVIMELIGIYLIIMGFVGSFAFAFIAMGVFAHRRWPVWKRWLYVVCTVIWPIGVLIYLIGLVIIVVKGGTACVRNLRNWLMGRDE